MNLEGKNFLILGASSGIGRNLSIRLIKSNANVTAIGRSVEKLKNLEKEVNSDLLKTVKFEVNSLEEFIDFLKSLIKKNSPYQGIFNSVGVENVKTLKLIGKRDFEEVFMPIFNSSLGLIKMSFKDNFLVQKGSIVIMSSVSSISGKAGLGLYASARGAVESLSRSAAHELSRKRKRINLIRAGAIQTEMHSRLISKLSQNQIDEYENQHLLGFGQPSDVSSMAMYLLSDESKWINGTTVNLDGGYLA